MPGAKLLIVDDEEDFVSAVKERLSLRNLTVFEAFSGEEGLGKLDGDPEIDVVLLDVKMPGIDGIETLRRIKTAHPLTEVIMLTGHATFESALEGMKLGAYDYLKKPYELEELLSKVNGARSRRQEQLKRIYEASGRQLRDRIAR